MKGVLCGIILLGVFFQPSTSFTGVTTTITSRHIAKVQNRVPKPLVQTGFLTINTISNQLQFAADDEQGDKETTNEGNFDGKGFAGYLAPYLAAFVASIAVTAAFVKFVLLDY